ncbi:Cytochrome P450 4d1, partial [Pseudolycoriella hygida]
IKFRKLFYSLKLPGPVPYPIIGNALVFLNKSPAENLQLVVKLLQDYGDILPGPVPFPIIGNGLIFLNKSPAENLQAIIKLLEDYGDIYIKLSDENGPESCRPRWQVLNSVDVKFCPCVGFTSSLKKNIEESTQRFSGNRKQNLIKWLKDFEQTAEILKWSNIHKLVYAKRLLTGAAKICINVEKSVTTYKQLQNCLKVEFGHALSSRNNLRNFFIASITMSVVIGTFLLCAIILILNHIIKFRKLFYSLKLPGPVPFPIIGNGLIFLNKSPAENLQVIVKLLEDYGDIVRLWLGPSLIVFNKKPKDVEVSDSCGSSGSHSFKMGCRNKLHSNLRQYNIETP